jgi:hypothetical protein
MIKKLIVALVILTSTASYSQNGSSSLYSHYGIGDQIFKGSAEIRSMGGVSVFSDSTHINFDSPAAYAGLTRTTFALGGSYSTSKIYSNIDEGQARRSSIDYMALAFPVTKNWAAAFGLMPFTSVGYRVHHNADASVPGDVGYRYTGNGGMNKVYVGTAYKLNSKFNVGVDLQYNFGEITTTGIKFLPGNDYGSRELNTSQLSGFAFNTSVMFQSKLKNKMDVFASVIFTPEASLDLGNDRNLATILFSDATGETVVDPQDIAVEDVTLKLPTRVAVGFGIGKVRHWLLGTEITFRNSSSMGNRFAYPELSNGTFENSQKYALGGYYIPDYNSFSSYFKRITYRAGMRYENTGLVVNDKPIDDMALTLGLGLPLRGTFSNINFGVEFGKRGTKAGDLVRENYTNFSVSLSLNDLWFIKSKYD